jgi:hypothetical protein
MRGRGDSEEETRRNFQDALIAHFEAMREVGEPIPEQHTSVDYVEVARNRRVCQNPRFVSRRPEPQCTLV